MGSAMDGNFLLSLNKGRACTIRLIGYKLTLDKVQ
jgi:hypothetical protein